MSDTLMWRRSSRGIGFDENYNWHGGGLRMGHDRNSRMPLENGGINFTRRGLFQRAAWVTPAAAFPCAVKLAAGDVSPVMTALSNYMSEARNRELPAKSLQGTKHHIPDTIAALVSGPDLPP